eukprot:9693577-Alexandrium_andersonii.AAC.1
MWQAARGIKKGQLRAFQGDDAERYGSDGPEDPDAEARGRMKAKKFREVWGSPPTPLRDRFACPYSSPRR